MPKNNMIEKFCPFPLQMTLLFLILAMAVLGLGKKQPQKENLKMVSVGSEIKIPCKLKGPELIWYWIPQYPICANVKHGSVAIFRNSRIMLFHFDNRLETTGEKSDLSLVLHLRILYMNDSGIFYCSNNQKNSSEIQVSVEPASNVSAFIKGKTVKLSCNPCNHQTSKEDTITWRLNGMEPPDKNNIHELRNSLIIKHFARHFYGLWSCHHSACKDDDNYGYCLENGIEVLKDSGHNENPPGMPGTPYIIGACIAGLLILFLGGGTVAYIIVKKRQSGSSRKITGAPKSLKGLEDSLKQRGKEGEPVSPEGTEGIQYTSLDFKMAAQQHTKTDDGNSTVVYAEMPSVH